MRIVHGDIRSAREPAILQQCNCLTRSTHGLSKTLAAAFPHCKVYVNRPGRGNRASPPATPGTIEVFRGQPDIVCLLGQFGPGTPGRWTDEPDSAALRQAWFVQALAQVNDYPAVAVPFGIGCGLAGGDWAFYHQALADFERASGIEVVLYKLQ